MKKNLSKTVWWALFLIVFITNDQSIAHSDPVYYESSCYNITTIPSFACDDYFGGVPDEGYITIQRVPNTYPQSPSGWKMIKATYSGSSSTDVESWGWQLQTSYWPHPDDQSIIFLPGWNSNTEVQVRGCNSYGCSDLVSEIIP